MAQWLAYSEKFSNTTPREQYLIIASGLVAIIFILYSLFLEAPIQRVEQLNKQVVQTEQSNKNNQDSIQVLEQALSEDPNVALRKQLVQYQAKLGGIDEGLLALTSDLIDPIQMRYALIKLLKLQKGVKLLSFKVLPASAVTQSKTNSSTDKIATATVGDIKAQTQQLQLYRHGINIKLQGQYFQLKDYLTQLESLSWTFFWQEFDYQLKEYPVSELEIEIYSLSTAQEFIGV
ncbi:type II secretion system protein M [Colwellia sp. MB02u-18]|uniref:type II secretion system protein GspM n=1 Tax=unclassified Colwellia TaxID=196834 RepID=UPI0015F71209|nr:MULTISPECIES: type II secretion system protein GspM [unclassified Colwellia]MBA6223719.1 type II secretion system protein M [Colwellia sp. MB3u-45]MBA6268449.1 type II secretion system protein M [Colwellia sp. MB3u-43]MBA6319900.1 type II secretion system protein M [Colwellia sp. MB02u-19]MBA6324556.1 type II secretion system protein M [Colwellia sp. MB02u-18]MBA6330711.1 type II secretion system protein M [Colwellia sp. MB02u-12]